MNAIFHRWRAQFLGNRPLREFLWFCVPGVLVAFVVRAWLMLAMPYGFYHPDTHDFLVPIHQIVRHDGFVIHNKTTFLTPVLYTLAFLPKLPALVIIPLGQHLRGLLLVLMIGALCRLWFRYWRVFVVPLTILAAIQPAGLFWEHTLMSESGFVFCAVWLALAGTIFVLRPTRATFYMLLAAMFFTAAARPEGNLLLGSGILMTLLVYGAQWRERWKEIGISVLLALLMLQITKTSHSGLLLYASLVHLTPDDPKVAPGLGPYIRPLRDEMRARRAEKVGNDVVRTGKRINAVLIQYLAANPDVDPGLAKGRRKRKKKDPSPPPAESPVASPELAGTAIGASPTPPGPPQAPAADDADSTDAEDELAVAAKELKSNKNLSNICRRLAIESALREPFAIPGIAARKFRATINEDPGGVFTDYIVHEKQARSIVGKGDMMPTIGPILAQQRLDTPELARAFVDKHYLLNKVAWFNTLEANWQRAINYFHLPATPFSDKYSLPGVPWFHALALLGAALSLAHPARLRRFQWAFLATLAGSWFIVTVTAAVIPRHRFVLEPFWLLYLFFLFDSILRLFAFLINRRNIRPVPQTTPAPDERPLTP